MRCLIRDPVNLRKVKPDEDGQQAVSSKWRLNVPSDAVACEVMLTPAAQQAGEDV